MKFLSCISSSHPTMNHRKVGVHLLTDMFIAGASQIFSLKKDGNRQVTKDVDARKNNNKIRIQRRDKIQFLPFFFSRSPTRDGSTVTICRDKKWSFHNFQGSQHSPNSHLPHFQGCLLHQTTSRPSNLCYWFFFLIYYILEMLLLNQTWTTPHNDKTVYWRRD